jgi:inorganic pyrophosphatase
MGILTNTQPWDLDTYGNNVKTLRVLIECPKGTTHKYEYDDKLQRMVIVRDLHPRYKYIYNYGCVPGTLAKDHDQLDAIVLSKEPIKSGAVVNTIPVAIVRTIDNGEQDDKLICVPYYEKTGSIKLKKIIKYLRNYKYPHNDTTEILNVDGAEQALEVIEEAINNFKENYK